MKGKENAKNLAYDQWMLDQIPDIIWESAAAVGNPFSIGSIHAGETVVDLGCGCRPLRCRSDGQRHGKGDRYRPFAKTAMCVSGNFAGSETKRSPLPC